MPDRSAASRFDVEAHRFPRSSPKIDAEPDLAGPWSMVNQCGSKRCEVSEKFILPDHLRPTVTHNDYTDLEIPVIDVSAILDRTQHDEKVLQGLVAQVRDACLHWGFFQIVNHGISEELLQRFHSQAKRFFALPFAEKMKVAKQDGRYTGYGHATVKKGDVRPWSEGFYFANDGSTAEVAKQLWPEENNNDFVDSYGEYNEKVQRLSGCLIRIISDSLDVDPAHIETYSKNTGGLLRWNFYPACPEPQMTLGLKSHTDFNLLTVLHQGDVGGLQIEKDGKWIAVRPRPGALAVNIGDTLQVLTNGKYKSVPHRAVVNATQARISSAYFYEAPQNVAIVPHPDLVDESNPLQYEPFTSETYKVYKQTQFLNTLDRFVRKRPDSE